MSKLLTFGCSNTYGHGLPDCWDADKKLPTENPSKFAWPSLLAKHMSLVCNNLSRPGSSCKEVWWKIVNTKFDRSDIVIVLWPNLDRSCIIDPENPEFPEHLAHWARTRAGKYFTQLHTFRNAYDREIEGKQQIQLADIYLKNQGVENVYHFITQEDNWSTDFQWFDVEIHGADNQAWGYRYFDKALDNHHPGIRSHQMLAEYIHKTIERQ